MFNDIFTALGVNLLRLSVDGEAIHRNRIFKPVFLSEDIAPVRRARQAQPRPLQKGKKPAYFIEGLQAGKRNAS
jgi:hypothetical protein